MNNLKELRIKAGLTQAELAEKAKVNKRMIEHFEQGFKDIRKTAFETGLNISEALNCDPRDIIPK